MRSADTSSDAHRAQLASLSRMSPALRIELAFAMSEQARAVAIAGIRARNPDLDEDSARLVLARSLLGDELFRAAWPGALLARS
jgi:hypothetical protein